MSLLKREVSVGAHDDAAHVSPCTYRTRREVPQQLVNSAMLTQSVNKSYHKRKLKGDKDGTGGPRVMISVLP